MITLSFFRAILAVAKMIGLAAVSEMLSCYCWAVCLCSERINCSRSFTYGREEYQSHTSQAAMPWVSFGSIGMPQFYFIIWLMFNTCTLFNDSKSRCWKFVTVAFTISDTKAVLEHHTPFEYLLYSSTAILSFKWGVQGFWNCRRWVKLWLNFAIN